LINRIQNTSKKVSICTVPRGAARCHGAVPRGAAPRFHRAHRAVPRGTAPRGTVRQISGFLENTPPRRAVPERGAVPRTTLMETVSRQDSRFAD